MTRRTPYVLAVCCLLFLLSGCASLLTPNAVAPLDMDAFHLAVDRIEEQQEAANKECPDHFSARYLHSQKKPNPVRRGTEFDPNSYFDALMHISLKDGHVLDYVYYYDRMGGNPILYVRRKDEAPTTNYRDYVKVRGLDYGRWPRWSMSNVTSAVRADGCRASFLELAVFHEMAPEFYEHWHLCFYKKIVTTPDDIDDILANWWQEDDPEQLTEEQRQELRQLDPTPEVEIRDATVVVTIFLFREGRGLEKTRYTFKRSYPHEILETETEPIARSSTWIR